MTDNKQKAANDVPKEEAPKREEEHKTINPSEDLEGLIDGDDEEDSVEDEEEESGS